MRTLALLLFVGFAVLNTTRGNDADTTETGLAGNTELHIIDNGHRQAAQAVPEPIAHSPFASSILWQFLSNIVNGFEQALNDQSLMDYAKEQGVDTSGSPTTLCQDPAHQSSHQSGMDKCNRKEFKDENLYCF